MEDYIVYRRVTEIQGTVIKAKSIEDANKKLAKINADFNKNPLDAPLENSLDCDFEFITYLDDQTYLPKKTIRVEDAKEELRPFGLKHKRYRKRK